MLGVFILKKIHENSVLLCRLKVISLNELSDNQILKKKEYTKF